MKENDERPERVHHLDRSVAADAAEVDVLEKADYMESFIYVLKQRGKSAEAVEMRRRVKEIWASTGKDREDL